MNSTYNFKALLSILILSLLSNSFFAQMQDHFVTTWKTDNAGISNTSSITIPTKDGGYNYDVDWNNDGIFDEFGFTGDATHDYITPGTYTVRIKGDFPRIYFNGGKFGYGLDKKKITSIDQWGAQAWTSMEGAFYGCSNLEGNYTDTPNLSVVTDMSEMFRRALKFNSPVDSWDVSGVTYMYGVFTDASSFNQAINSWDVSSVYNTFAMFAHAVNFNQPLDNWNVSSITVMEAMFSGAEIFNQNINSWNVSKAINMEAVFLRASSYNQAMDNWNVSSVKKMHKMFQDAISFDQNIGMWDTRNVEDMENMFSGATLSIDNYDALLIGWNNLPAPGLYANVNFHGGNSKYCAGEIARQNMINNDSWIITDAGKQCVVIEVPNSHFVTTWMTDNPGTSNNSSITIPTNGSGYSYQVDWNNDEDFDDLGEDIIHNGNITHDFGSAGEYTIRIKGDFPSIYFNNGGDKEKLMSVDQWGSIQWSSMNRAFYGCSNLDGSISDNPDLSSVTDMRFMFFGAEIFNQPLDSWNVSNIKLMYAMFSKASNFNQPLNSWNVSSVINMNAMFLKASSFNQPLDQWDMNSVKGTRSMFSYATNFNQDLNSWDLGKVTNMSYMFEGSTSFNMPIDAWNVSSVSKMKAMFHGATAFDQNIGSWDVRNIIEMEDMFKDATLSTTNYDLLLIGWNDLNSPSINSNIIFDGGNSKYCSSNNARQNLIDNASWTITDGGIESPSCN